MAIIGNFKGTTQTEFKIGKTGPTIYTTASPPQSNVYNGDYWLDKANNTISVRKTNAWISLGSTLSDLNVGDGTLLVDTANDSVSVGAGGLYIGNVQIIDGTGAWLGNNNGLIGYTGSKGNIAVTIAEDPNNSPAYGDIWIDSNTSIQYVYVTDGNSSQWVELSNPGAQGYTGSAGFTGSAGATGFTGSFGSVSVSSSPPGSPSAGALWWEDTSGMLKIYYNDGTSSQWVDAVSVTEGPRGNIGYSGSVGFTGSIGGTGFTGSFGNIGYTGSQGVIGYTGSQSASETIIIACSDETTALTAGTAKVTFRMPYAMTLSNVKASLSTAQSSGSTFTVDINEEGTSILSTKLTIDNTEKTSTTADVAAVISDSSLANDAEVTIDIDQVGDGTAKGLKVTLTGTRA